MSTSIWYHGFGIRGRGWHHRHTEFSDGTVVATMDQDESHFACRVCHARDVVRQGTVIRRLRAGNMNSMAFYVAAVVQRVKCKKCGAVRQMSIPFANEHSRYTKGFERYVLDLSKEMTIQALAKHLGVSWDVVKDIQKRYLGRKFPPPKLNRLEAIGIDEIYLGKKHRFRTVVLDLVSGAVVFVGQGKGAAALDLFWKKLGKSKNKIRAVAADLSPAYTQAVREHLPKATLVFDHFHVIKLMNDKLTELRRELHREVTDLLQKDVLKGIRWLLVKNSGNLDEKRNERERLEEALRLNEPLAKAYYMKEELGLVWKQPDKTTARVFLNDWIARAEVSGVRMLQKFAKTLAIHREGILAYYDHPISTGPLEAVNNKIKLMQRQAYGYRDIRFFTLKIYACHQMKYALVG
jgi:transposase